MARCLQRLRAWEELAEDPFRGLRAGPADFSPFSLLPMVARNASGLTDPSNTPNDRLRQRCAASKKTRNSINN